MYTFVRRFSYLVFALLTSLAHAQNAVQSGGLTATSFESTFVGSYRQGSVDALSELVLFDDNTFCYALTAGAMDKLVFGRWATMRSSKASHDLKSIYLIEERAPNAPTYPIVASQLKRLNQQVEIVFDGRTMSEASSPVFALSSTNAVPMTFRPLFVNNMDSWAESYFYTHIQADQAKYLFIGDFPTDASGRPQNKLRVFQYKLDSKFDTYRVYLNMAVASPELRFTAKITDGILSVDGERWSAKQNKSQEWLTEAKATCQAARNNATSLSTSSDQDTDAVSTGAQQGAAAHVIKPFKTLQLEKKVIVGQAVFGQNYQSNKHGYDSIDEVIKQETAALFDAYTTAKASSAKIDAYLQLSKQIVDANVRLKEHSAPLADQYAQLINATNTKRDFQSTTKVLFHFVNHILTGIDPFIASLDKGEKRQSQYRLSVIASQSLAASVETKNEAMSQLVFDKILTPKFDIKTHENATLIYNLACFYALKGNKPQMLEAVVQARLRGKPAKQFMDDSDFKNFLSDADFLAALN